MKELLKGKKLVIGKSILFRILLDSYWPYAGPNLIAVRTDRYKLVKIIENDIDELYDLKHDPGELNNLINNDNYDKIEEELRNEAID